MSSDVHDDEPSYWHGGPPGIGVGDRLQPRQASKLALSTYRDRGAEYVDRVYFGTDLEFARSWAATYAVRHGQQGVTGSVYRVRPIGRVERDPDFLFGDAVSWMSPAAEVVEVEETEVVMPATESTRRVGQYMYWPDGTPMYSSHGFLTRGPEDPPHIKMLNPFLGPWRSIYDDTMPYEMGYLMQAHASGSLAGITPEAVRRIGEESLRRHGPARQVAH